MRIAKNVVHEFQSFGDSGSRNACRRCGNEFDHAVHGIRQPANNKLNRTLEAAGIVERVMQGNGYVYFVKGEAARWRSSSIPVCWMRDLTPESVVENWKWLSGNTHTPEEVSQLAGRGLMRASSNSQPKSEAYMRGVATIALNDNPSDPHGQSAAYVARYVSVSVLADVFELTTMDVAKAVVQFRRNTK